MPLDRQSDSRPVLRVDFNDGGCGRLWARRDGLALTVGQRVVLEDPGELRCEGVVFALSPRDWEGKPCPEYVELEIVQDTWEQLS